MKKLFDEFSAKEKVLEKSKENGYTFLGFENGYLNQLSKIVLLCNKDGYQWTPTFYDFVIKSCKCRQCLNMPVKNEGKVIQEIQKKCDDLNYSFLGFKDGKYIKSKNKIIIQCNKDFHIWEPTYDNFIKKGSNCPKCSGNPRINEIDSLKNITEQTKKNNHELIGLVGEFNNGFSRYKIKCKKCLYEWETSYKSYNRRDSQCKKCFGTAKLTNQEAIEIITQKCIERNYEFLNFKNNLYENSKSILIIKCKKHNKEWELKYNNFIHQNNGCLICKESKGELEVRTYLNKNNIKFIPQHKFEKCKNKKLLSFDFYLPKYNICIEFDGAQHFHPSFYSNGKKGFKGIKRRDRIKTKYCSGLNGRPKLIRISYKKYNKIEQILNQKLPQSIFNF